MSEILDSVSLVKLSIFEQELTDPFISQQYRECLTERIEQLKHPPPPKLAEQR